MAGLIAASFAAGAEKRADKLFERACSAYTALKGQARNSASMAPGFRVARLATAGSACPEVRCLGPETWAAAGWWFDPDAPVGASSLSRLASEPDPERTLARLQGQFLVVRFAQGRLLASGDRLGMFPVYAAERDGVALISTSAAALASSLGAPIEAAALWALFMGDAIRAPRSAFEGIRRLGIGERAIAEDGRLRVERVWSPYIAERPFRTVEDAADAGIAVLERTCAEVRRTWPRWVADLTSGLDSRLVLAAMGREGSVHTTVNGPPEHVDVRISRVISDHFGWKHDNHRLPRDWGAVRWDAFRLGVALADGEMSGGMIDRAVDAKLTLRTSFDCSLSGGAGELLRDFFWTQNFLSIGRSSKLDVNRLLASRFFFSEVPELGFFEPGWRAAYRADQRARIGELEDMAPEALNTAKLDAVYLWKNSGHFGRFQGALHPLIVSVMPLATQAVVEFGMSVPWRFRLHSSLIRHMITRLSPRLAALPTHCGGSARPLSLRRPGDAACYGTDLAKRVVRKVGQVAFRRSLIPDPTRIAQDRRWETDLVSTLRRQGMLDIGRLRTAPLYRGDGLRAFLEACRQPSPGHLTQLHALASVEWLARVVADPSLATRQASA